MKNKRGFGRITEFANKAVTGKRKRFMLVALSVILSLNIILASVPGAVFATADGAVDSLSELIDAIENTKAGQKSTINLSGSFDIYETVVIDGGRDIVLTPSWGTVTLKRSAGFKGELFNVSGDTENDVTTSSALTISNGVVVDGNASVAAANAPLVKLSNSGVLNLNGTLQNNNNTAADSKGGAVYAEKKSAVNINGGSILRNEAYTGGGIYADDSSVELIDGKLNSNIASYMGGGAYLTDCPKVKISGSVTGTNPKPETDYSTTVYKNTAPIGAGLYYANKPVNGTDYTISGGVYIDGNTTAASPLALPDAESNLLMETCNDAPSFMGVSANTRVGLYPMENGTRIPCEMNYIGMQNSAPIFFDSDNYADFLKSKTDYADGIATINVGTDDDMVVVLNSYNGGSVNTDIGQKLSRGKVYPGFPVHFVVTTEDGYILEGGTFNVGVRDGAAVKNGTAANGLWYIFDEDNTYVVNAKFVNGVPEASVKGVNYLTLADAFAACAGKPSAEVILLDDITLDETINVPAGCSVTLSKKYLGKDTENNEIYADKITRFSSKDVAFKDSMFIVGESSELILNGIVLDGGNRLAYPVTGADSAVKVYGKLVMTGLSSICNSDAEDDGGAVYLNNGILKIMSGSGIFNNSAKRGAGVYMTGSESEIRGDGETVTSEIYSNRYSVSGGGVYMEDGAIYGCEISTNTPADGAADTKGGGIYAVSGQIIDSTVGRKVAKNGLSNVAAVGGGIYAEDLAMKNVEIANNHATDKAGGVFYLDDLFLSNYIVITQNTATVPSATAPLNSNLYFDTAAGKPVNVSGKLTNDKESKKISQINMFLSSADTAVSGKDIADNDSAADAVANLDLFKLNNSTSNIAVTSNDMIELVSASECITVTLVRDADSGSFDTVPDCGKEIKLKAAGGTASFILDNPYSDNVELKVSDNTAISVEPSESESNVYVITALEAAVPGSSHTVTIDTSYDYVQSKVEADVEISNVGGRYDADNYKVESTVPKIGVTYSASKMNPHTDTLNATYVEWKPGDAAVKTQLSSAKEDQTGDSFEGYIVLEPAMSEDPGDGATTLGSIKDVPYVTINLDVSDFADEGDYIDVVSYNGTPSTGNKGKAVLHNDLLVRNGEVAFDVTRGTGGSPDKIYVAIVEHDDYAASIGSQKYHTLDQAFDAVKSDQEIKVLRDCVINSALLVPNGVNVTLSSEDGARISRSEFYNGAMVFVESGAELTVKNIVLDGGAQIVSTSPVTNSGVYADAAVLVNYGTLAMSGSSGIENGCQQGDYYGGALYNGSTGSAVIKDAVFAGNYASYGGAVYNKGNLEMDGCVVKENYAKINGGGIYSQGELELIDTMVTANQCSDPGAGGVYTSAVMSVGGATCVSGNTDGSNAISNVVNSSGQPIVINEALADSARIGVTEPQTSGAVIAVGDGSKVKDASSYKNCFFPDTGNLTVASKDKAVVYDSKTATYVTVDLSAGANGSISPAGDVRVKSGDDLSVTITPDSNYAVADVFVDGESILDDVDMDDATGNVELVMSKVKANSKVEATFKRAPGSVITPTASTGGSISPSDKINVNSEEAVKFTITPNEGYYLDSLKMSGKDVLASAVLNKDGSYTYTASGVTDENASLNAEFKPIYTVRTLVDEGSGVQVKGSLHYKAYLTVENLAEFYPSLYNQMKSALTNDKTITQFIAQAYEIKLNFENEQEMEGWSKIKPNTSVELTFNLGDSYKGKTVRIFHLINNDIDKTTHFGVVNDTGKFSITTSSLSPFAVVVQEKASTSTDGTNGTNGTGGSNTTGDGKGPVSGDYTEPKTIPPVVIILTVLSSAAIIFVVSKYYLPRFIAYMRAKYSVR